MRKLLLGPWIKLGKAILKPLRAAGLGIGRLGLRGVKITALALLASAAIFLLDMLLVRDSGRPGEPPSG